MCQGRSVEGTLEGNEERRGGGSLYEQELEVGEKGMRKPVLPLVHYSPVTGLASIHGLTQDSI